MTISAIHLKNFRGFQDETLLLRPLTVLLGPNSSGKSSFGHAFAATTHCQRRNPGGQRPTLTPGADSDEWPTDLGTINDLRTHGQSGRVYIGFQTEAGLVDLGFGVEGSDNGGLFLSYICHPFDPKSSVGLQTTPQQLNIQPGADARSSVEPIQVEKLRQLSTHIAVHKTKESDSTWWDENDKQQAVVDLDGLLLRSVQHFGRTFIPLKREAQETLRFLFENLTYLRATRKRPSRSYKNDIGQWQGIGYAGEWTPTILQENGESRVFYLQPPRIPRSLEEAKSSIEEKWQERNESLIESVRLWLDHLGLAKSIESVHSPNDRRRLQVRVTLPGQLPHDITEVGLGVSQALPVLTAGLLQPQNSLFVVDLPEAHLHPWPQACIADFFCSLALSGRSALVETHSEMFFHRLRLRAEMSPELLDKIAVYFLDAPKDGKCSKPTPIGLAVNEGLRWPVGFLAEAWDTEKSIRIIREARSVRV